MLMDILIRHTRNQISNIEDWTGRTNQHAPRYHFQFDLLPHGKAGS